MQRVTLEAWRDPSALAGVRVAPDFAAVVRSPALPRVLASCLAGGAVTVAALSGGELCGYATVVPSSALVGERWHDLPDLCELGALEVARSARRRRIAIDLLDALQATLPASAWLLMARGACGSWDLDAAGLAPRGYRRMLIGLLARVGFAVQPTDDPQVAEHFFNFLALRAGADVPGASRRAFEQRLATARSSA